MDIIQIALLALLIYFLAYALINRICRCVEFRAIANASAKCKRINDLKDIQKLMDELDSEEKDGKSGETTKRT